MTQALAETRPEGLAAVVESVVIQGDLAKLQPGERVSYYRSVCESLGLNPQALDGGAGSGGDRLDPGLTGLSRFSMSE